MSPDELDFRSINEKRSNGVSDNKIINELNEAGLSPKETYDKMQLADLAASSINVAQDIGVKKMDQQNIPNPNMNKELNNIMNSNQNVSAGNVPPVPNNQPNTIQQPRNNVQSQQVPLSVKSSSLPTLNGVTIEEIEELVETIIDERWKEVTRNLKKLIDWKNSMDLKFERMDQEVKDVKGNFTELYKAVVGKVGDYDRNLLKVGTDLKAMEKVFSKILPTFTENVNDLSRIADDIRNNAVNKK